MPAREHPNTALARARANEAAAAAAEVPFSAITEKYLDAYAAGRPAVPPERAPGQSRVSG